MDIWSFIYTNLSASTRVILLCVLSSEGSSPGRQGFKMAVTASGDFMGTIGGGIMEKKLVAKAKKMLSQQATDVLLMHQYHDKQHASGRSGMICSGSQLNAFIPLSEKHLAMFSEIIDEQEPDTGLSFVLSHKGIRLAKQVEPGLIYQHEAEWQYAEPIHHKPVLHIFGGGHTGLALSELMNFVGFYVKIYDDRPALNTMQQNNFATEKHLVNYERLDDFMLINPNDFIVIMTIGYRTDKLVLKQLLKKESHYLGLLGSISKIKKLTGELIEEGLKEEALAKIFAPVGLNIFSKTPREIAVSIAAEIIFEKNRLQPSARSENVKIR